MGRIGDGQGILAADAVVHGTDSDFRIFNGQVILAGNAVLIVSVDGQGAAAGDDQVGLGIQAGVGFFVRGRGQGICKGVLAAVREGVVRAGSQKQLGGLGFVDIQRGAVGAGDVRIAEDEGHILALGVDDDPPVGQGTGEGVRSAFCNGNDAAVNAHAGARSIGAGSRKG